MSIGLRMCNTQLASRFVDDVILLEIKVREVGITIRGGN